MTGNQLKILALVSMTLDHIGVVLFPGVYWLRVAGRLAFPVFAYMVAEGCFYTRDKARYLGLVCALGFACQVVFWLAAGSLEQSILTTFALSMVVVFAFQLACEKRRWWSVLAFAAAVSFSAFACLALPGLLPGTGFRVDYGFVGVLLPLLCSIPRAGMTRAQARDESPASARKRRVQTLALLAAGLVLLALSIPDFVHGVQWWGLLALAPLALYNGKRGTWPLKYLFYVYYPLHLVVIYGIYVLV